MEYRVYCASTHSEEDTITKYPKLNKLVFIKDRGNYYGVIHDIYAEINTLEDIKKISKACGKSNIVIDFDEPGITIYDDYLE